MEQRTIRLITDLGKKIAHLEQPIHLLAVCSGGMTLAKTIDKHLRSKKIDSKYFEVWTNIINGKKEIWKTDFLKENYSGTAVIVEDVIWKGSALPPIKKMLRIMKPRKKIFVISLLDCNKKADFSIFK
jgi:hypoxanthine-guanine phosphoribosyltransferase